MLLGDVHIEPAIIFPIDHGPYNAHEKYNLTWSNHNLLDLVACGLDTRHFLPLSCSPPSR